MSEAPERQTKLSAPNRARAEAPGLLPRRWASTTGKKMCGIAVTAPGSRSRE